jgi:hypothetical protein
VQIGGLRFFDDAVRVVALRRVKYPAIAEPKRDVRRSCVVAVGDQVAAA